MMDDVPQEIVDHAILSIATSLQEIVKILHEWDKAVKEAAK